jgi:Asp-tRNA(Asn)/Glu-tRNA(Gln) amidotransferase A subunit family amidase
MLNRRVFLSTCGQFGLAGTLFPGVLWALAQGAPKITIDMIEQAAAIADVPIPPEDREMMLPNLNDAAAGYEKIYAMHLPNGDQPSLIFDPVVPGIQVELAKRPMRISAAPRVAAPASSRDLDGVALHSVRKLAELVRTRKVSSTGLTQMYLERLKRYGPVLHCVITLTEERALAQARQADREIAAGRYRGPLHGIPWGAKDLLAAKGYPTTWGAGGFEHQMIDEDATVVRRLDAAGAVLVAKLTTGALALGDHWFGGITRNPWNTNQGSSGSSAGPASATAAGLVGFSIGSETLGSISSPSTRCGCTGLRPSFGLVPRTGAMALSWSMDKLGPICRAVEDCALVLDAIHGPDGRDRFCRPAAFNWDADLDWRKLRIGYLKAAFEREPGAAGPGVSRVLGSLTPEQQKLAVEVARYDKRFTDAALEQLHKMVPNLVPVELPQYPYDAMVAMLWSEGAAAFDELTRTGRDKLLTSQTAHDWPNIFRSARFVPAIEYIQASRARLVAMEALARAFADVDVVVTPTSGDQLTVTNLTGNPALIVPNGFRGDDAPAPIKNAEGFIEGDYGGPGTPVSLTFLGHLYGEAKIAAFGKAYQDATGFHLKHPRLET